ncbi:MAG: DMT family transporter [Moorea sp. SIO1F2]|uniref:DMT family transporter n=1 Tax=unclassified Moorena TaxID=2683338 RepID=UPI0013B785A8|nr:MULTISPECIES: DMT family transporter [unclassified Moorena]NEN96106.1 DMT family transporter [Moorena sp. SIO3I7]NEO47245.1 DMT family transporter [Moorena sp. SIO4A3]NEO05382.1 DMT family transporter [Moorena sp. SIO3I8]NEO21137.1 DMT family transporter [Moorena sp. SIO4A5]NEP22547.1 DMT family transporter [Moorena sp. SIO3I6]
MTDQFESTEEQFSQTLMIMAIAALFFALIFLSSTPIFIRFSEREISASATAFNRFWISTTLLGLWKGLQGLRCRISLDKPITQDYLPDSGWVWGGLLGVGIFFSADIIIWAWSLTQTSVANATLLANLTPVFTILGGWLVWKRGFESKFLMGMSLAMAGAIAIGLEDWQITTGKVEGDIAAILASITFAVYLLILERLQTRLKATTILFWSSAIATVFSLPIALLSGDNLFPYSWQGWSAILCFALVCQILGQWLLVYSLDHFSSGFVAVFLLLEPVLAAIGAWILFYEQLSLFNWIAFGVVLGGIYLALSSEYKSPT